MLQGEFPGLDFLILFSKVLNAIQDGLSRVSRLPTDGGWN